MAKNKINSRAKGASGEREAAQFWSERGYPAIRGRQHSGASDAPDIKFITLKGIHCEVKRVQQLDLEGALTQSEMDAGDNIPIVMHRKNGDRWKVTLDARDFMDIFVPAMTCYWTGLPGCKESIRESIEIDVAKYRTEYKATQAAIRQTRKTKAGRKRNMQQLPEA